jgi:hypothetical protein
MQLLRLQAPGYIYKLVISVYLYEFQFVSRIIEAELRLQAELRLGLSWVVVEFNRRVYIKEE